MILLDWYEQAKKLKAEGKSLSEIANILNMSYKTVESRFYRDNLRSNKPSIKTETNLQDSILKELSKGCAITYLCDKYKASERVIKATIEDIQDAGLQRSGRLVQRLQEAGNKASGEQQISCYNRINFSRG